MPEFDTAFLVQDKDSGLFLCPREGDVGYTKYVDQAGPFDSYEEALDTAKYNLGANFIIWSFGRLVRH
ncbi:hypothetical protein N8I74_12255 [Chitiniphilus purpureus]|uniref:SPOR domain-containing protein n=1 Tax=Chitiniphilus purpureus TaxID=2981137 RepID=A0ABY6DLW2_9NEIS|nr:hypothetical protein [Chitiniphilus sp. CD1]UXY14091.1 hypothetical protein N8I74_12255 [Chitiniphilus sp. CD1]